MDRTWMTCNQLSIEYQNEIVDLLDFAILNVENQMSIRCSCTFCCKMEFYTPQEIKDHLFEKCFLAKYRVWTWHGETNPISTSTKCQYHPHSQRFRCYDYNDINESARLRV